MANQGQGGFGQPFGSTGFNFGQPTNQPFGQQPQQFSFGAAPSPSPPPPQGFNFGQQQQKQPQAPQQQPTFGFGQQQQQSAAPAIGGFGQLSPSSFTFGAAPAAAPQQQQQQPASFDFGSSLRKKPERPPPLPPAFGKKPQQQFRPAEEEEEEFDYEAAKKAALANMPSFQGGGAGGGGGGAPKPSHKKASHPPSSAGQSDAEDPTEVARRAQRANRFAPVPVTAPPPPPPPPRRQQQTFFQQPQQQQQQQLDEMDGGGKGGDEDDYGGGGAGKGPIVGTCEEMCPASERERRQNMSDIQIFERIDPANPNMTSAELAVKRFARTVDDPHPSEFRTRGALTRTMDYLRSLLDRTDVRFGLVHKFLWDRYRSIRQDLYIQGITDEFAINIFEEIVRFHVLCEHELCGEDQSVTDMEGFNSHLNMEQMNKALISLNEMYNKAAADGRPAPNEAEFRAYHLISLMAQHGKFKGDQQAFLSTLQALRPEVRDAPIVQWVLRLRASFVAGNYVRFFLLVQEASYLPACAAHTYFPAVRAKALRTLSETFAPTAARPAAVEVFWLRQSLMLDTDEEAMELAAMHGFAETMMDETGQLSIALCKGEYTDPPPPVAKRSSAWISNKAQGLRSVCVTRTAGLPLTPEQIEEQKRIAQRHREAAEAARAAAEAEAYRRRQEAAAAAAEQERLKQQAEDQQRREEEERQRAEQARVEAQKRAEEETQRQREMAAAAKAKRLAEEAAERERKAAAERAAVEAARRAAEESERRRLEEERRRREAEEAERRRREEEERRKAEELRKKIEALRSRVFERRYFAKWLAAMKRIIAERKHNERIAASLKACRVGVNPLSISEQEVEAAMHNLDLEGDRQEKNKQKQKASIDIPALVAPFVAKKNPEAQSLFWKTALLSSLPSASSSNADVLHRWLQLQLSGGDLVQFPSYTAYVDGPLEIFAAQQSTSQAVVTSCIAVAASTIDGGGSSVFTGASGIILTASPDVADAEIENYAKLLKSNSAVAAVSSRIPVLLVASNDEIAQKWLAIWQKCGHLAHSINISSSSIGNNNNGNDGKRLQSFSFNKTHLIQGIRWLASHAPSQPMLTVIKLEDATRDALTAVLKNSGDGATPVLALKKAIDIVSTAINSASTSVEAAWQWPPPEISEGALKGWYTKSTHAALLSALEGLKIGYSVDYYQYNDAVVALYSKISQATSTVNQPLVLPAAVFHGFCGAMERAAVEERMKLLVSSSPTRQQKRKWRHSPDSAGASSGDGRAKLRQSLASVEKNLAVERSIEHQFEAELMQTADAFGISADTNASNAAASEEVSPSSTSKSPVQSRALQELQVALQAEKKASRSLWSRMKSLF